MLLADFLTQYRKRKIILVENDTSNPDVGKTFIHSDDVEVLSLSLDEADGWIELVNYCEATDKDLAINSAARSGEAVEKFGGTLIGSIDELHRQLISFWASTIKGITLNFSKSIWTSFPVKYTSSEILSTVSLQNSSYLIVLSR